MLHNPEIWDFQAKRFSSDDLNLQFQCSVFWIPLAEGSISQTCFFKNTTWWKQLETVFWENACQASLAIWVISKKVIARVLFASKMNRMSLTSSFQYIFLKQCIISWSVRLQNGCNIQEKKSNSFVNYRQSFDSLETKWFFRISYDEQGKFFSSKHVNH